MQSIVDSDVRKNQVLVLPKYLGVKLSEDDKKNFPNFFFQKIFKVEIFIALFDIHSNEDKNQQVVQSFVKNPMWVETILSISNFCYTKFV